MPQAFRDISRQVQAAPLAAVSVFGLALAGAAPAQAQSCGRDGSGFPAWLAAFRQQAVAQGIPAEVVAASLDGVSYDRAIISRDRGQGVFQQSFLQFAGRMVADYRLKTGANRIRQHAGLFSAIERQYGVPPGPLAKLTQTCAHDVASTACRRSRSSPSGGWRPISAPTRARTPR